jgi:hypothetical protein
LFTCTECTLGLPERSGGSNEVASDWVSAQMKIATFNINNVNRRLPNLLQWLEEAWPDIVCLQEQCVDRQFPTEAIRWAE